eukprot:1185710-Prorocentrum_minimum.AAC.1
MRRSRRTVLLICHACRLRGMARCDKNVTLTPIGRSPRGDHRAQPPLTARALTRHRADSSPR